MIANPHRAEPLEERYAVHVIPISDEVTWRFIPRERFRHLSCDPLRSRIGGNVDPDQMAPAHADDDKTVQQTEDNCRSYEEIDGGYVGRVVSQKGAPTL